MNRIANFLTGAPYDAPPDSGNGDYIDLGPPINDPTWDYSGIEAQRQAEIDARYQSTYNQVTAQLQAAKDAVASLINAPAGTLAIGGLAMLALGLAGEHTGLRFLRWIGGGTLAASALIAVRRSTAGIE